MTERKKKKKIIGKRYFSVFSVERNKNIARQSAVMSANSATEGAITNQVSAGTSTPGKGS